MTKNLFCQEKKWASRNLISVDDFGLGKGQDFVIFFSTSDSTMLALSFAYNLFEWFKKNFSPQSGDTIKWRPFES